MKPTVSFVIPAYNAAAFVVRALASIENQTCKPDEVVVIDDGSTDPTSALVTEFSKTSGLNIVLLRQSNRGSPAARNHGIMKSNGDLIAFMDADDYIYPDFLEQMVLGLNRYSDWVACFSDRDVVGKNGNFIGKDLDHPLFRRIHKTRRQDGFVELSDDGLFAKTVGGSVIPMTIVCRRSDVVAISGFDETVLFHDDRIFMLKLIKHGAIGYLEKSLGVWQRHDTNKTSTANWKKNFAYSDLILAKILGDKKTFRLSPYETRVAEHERRKLAVGWVYAASNNRSATIFSLACKMLTQRRITILCALTAFARYFYGFLSTRSTTRG